MKTGTKEYDARFRVVQPPVYSSGTYYMFNKRTGAELQEPLDTALKDWQRFAQGYVVVMRSVPMLLQMFLAYFFTKAVYGAFNLPAADMDKAAIVTAALTLNAAGFLSEEVRSALLSVERRQQEAGESVGLTQLQIIRYLVLPQCLPVVRQGFISLIKGSAAAYLLGVIEMIQGTAMKTAGNYRYLEAYCATAIIYWGLTMLVERFTFVLEWKVRRHAE